MKISNEMAAPHASMKIKLISVFAAAAFQFGCTTNPAGYTQPEVKKDFSVNQPPHYSPESRRAGEQGKVILRALVTKTGEVASVGVNKSSGYERLDLAAIKAVRTWQFNPATKNGEPVEDWTLVPIVFSLKP